MRVSTICSVCKAGRAITDPESGEMVCSDCGLVLSEKASEGRAEWRNFGSEASSRARTGSPVSLAHHDMGLNTVIGNTDRDSSGQNIHPSMLSVMHRLRMWNARSQIHTTADKNLLRAFSELGRQKDKLGLSDAAIDKTAYVYRKAFEKGLLRGRSISAVLAAAIYIACREMGAARSIKDISEINGVKRKIISRSYRILVQELGIVMPVVDPMRCIVKIANNAKLSEKTKRMALDTMKKLIDTESSAGKAPMGFAATILYLSCLKNNEDITQRDIAEAAGVTEVTIRNRVRDLKSRKLSIANKS